MGSWLQRNASQSTDQQSAKAFLFFKLTCINMSHMCFFLYFDSMDIGN